MNKTIRDIERESGIDVYSLGKDRAKWEAKLGLYTEMIVQECIRIAHPKPNDVGEWAAGMRLVQKRLKEHFGVE